MRFSWQNLNEKPGGLKGSPLRHGRAWLHMGKYTLGWEWSLWRSFCHAHIDIRPDRESTLGASVALPGVAFWVHLDTPWGHRLASLTRRRDGSEYGTDRRVGLSVHGWALLWDCWADGMEWRSKDPRWMHGSFNFPDRILGRQKYSTREIETRMVRVPMPEYGYPASATLTLDEWRRPRWPWPRRLLRVNIEIPGGIPEPGKGENSWDCGEDATFGMTCVEPTIEAGIAHLVESVLSTRRRHGGLNWTPARPAEKDNWQFGDPRGGA